MLGKRTGAFEAVVSRDPAVFARESLSRFDAVLLNNTVGDLFDDPGLREDLRSFLYSGGGLLGYHGSSVAFQKWPGAVETWPEFGRILGARGCTHREPNERAFLRIEDPAHAITRAFAGATFELADEYFRFIDPYSRDRLRVLLSIDTARTDMAQGRAFGSAVRPDGDYAVSWVKEYGRGRVFYCSFGHNPSVFRDPTVLRFWLAALQFTLGDLPAGTTPSARLTPAARAEESLAWRIEAVGARGETISSVIAKAAATGIRSIGAGASLQLDGDGRPPLGPDLPEGALVSLRDRLSAADARLLTYRADPFPPDAAGTRKLFAFARKLGIETVIAAPDPARLEAIEKLCDEFEIQLAIPASADRSPDGLLEAIRPRGARIGVCLEVGGEAPPGGGAARAIDAWKDRIVAIRIEASGDRIGRAREILERIGRLGDRPRTIGLAAASDSDLARWAAEIGEIAIELARGKR